MNISVVLRTLFLTFFIILGQTQFTRDPCRDNTDKLSCEADKIPNRCRWIADFNVCFAEWVFNFDVCFAIDASESIDDNQWQSIKEFLEDTLSLVDPKPRTLGNVRVGLVTFHTVAFIERKVIMDVDDAIEVIKKLPHRQDDGGATHTINAIRTCLDLLDEAIEGKTEIEKMNDQQILFLITENNPNGPVACGRDADRTCGVCDAVPGIDDETMIERILNNGIRTMNVYLESPIGYERLNCLVEQTVPQGLILKINRDELTLGRESDEFNKKILDAASQFCRFSPAPTRAPTAAPVQNCLSPPVPPVRPPNNKWWWWPYRSNNRRLRGYYQTQNENKRRRLTQSTVTCDECDTSKDEHHVSFLKRDIDVRAGVLYTRFCYRVSTFYDDGHTKYCDNNHFSSALQSWSLRLSHCCIVDITEILASVTKNNHFLNLRWDPRLSVGSSDGSSYFIRWTEAMKPGTSNEFCFKFKGNIGMDNDGQYCVQGIKCGCQRIEAPEPTDFNAGCQ